MSSWIVSKRHIDALVTGLVRSEVVAPAEYGDEDALGQLLWDENHRSVNYRYDEETKTPEYRFVREPVDSVTLLKLLHCYDYQTCEHPEWDDKFNRAHLWVDALVKQLTAAGITTSSPGYDDAPWGVD